MPIVPAGTTAGVPDFSPAIAGHSGEGVAAAPVGGMPFKPDHCVGLTKDGHACSARPMKGTELCYGHTRSQDA